MSFPYRSSIKATPYGLHVPYNKGYDAFSRRNAPTPEKRGGASGFLLRGNGAKIELWISDLVADFSLSGQYAQSHRLREFFPRSFNDVTLTVTGNVASTQEFNRLALFIREHQWETMRAIEAGVSTDQTMNFVLFDNTPKAWHGKTRTGDAVLAGDTSKGANVKGRHRPWSVQGYVKSIAAGATALEVAPQFKMEFIVAFSTLTANTGLWSDIAARPSILKSILQLLGEVRQTKGLFVTDPYPVGVSKGNNHTSSPSEPSIWSTHPGVKPGGGGTGAQ